MMLKKTVNVLKIILYPGLDGSCTANVCAEKIKIFR